MLLYIAIISYRQVSIPESEQAASSSTYFPFIIISYWYV